MSRAPRAAVWAGGRRLRGVAADCTASGPTRSFAPTTRGRWRSGSSKPRIPAGASILVQPYSVPLTPSRESLIEALTQNLGGADAASTKFQIQLGLDPYPAPAYRLIWLGRGGLDAEKIYVDPAVLASPGGHGGAETPGRDVRCPEAVQYVWILS